MGELWYMVMVVILAGQQAVVITPRIPFRSFEHCADAYPIYHPYSTGGSSTISHCTQDRPPFGGGGKDWMEWEDRVVWSGWGEHFPESFRKRRDDMKNGIER